MRSAGTSHTRTPAAGRLTHPALVALVIAALPCCVQQPETSSPAAAGEYAVEEKTVAALQADMASGRITARALTERYLARIRELDQAGPTLRSVLSVNPRALDDAARLDAERAAGKVRSGLHGIPILLKDNIESADPLPTTAGSLALRANLTGRDAPLVSRLRDAGAVVLGKANLSEWANIRASVSVSGWSAAGGLTRNPYVLDRNACGSSSGSAVAVAANLAALAVGTETDGSITCPAAVNGLVGIKPTVGLVSRRHIVPISHTQDTAGPMTRTVADAAIMLAAMAGADPQDAATADADRRRQDYPAALSASALAGKRLGVMRFSMQYHAALDQAFEAAAAILEAAGATLVDIREFRGLDAIGGNELPVLLTELKATLDDYLAGLPPSVEVRSLADVIAFNRREADRELVFFGQDLFERAASSPPLSDAAYLRLRAANLEAAGSRGIDRLLEEHTLDALIAPTMPPAWTTDLVNGDHVLGGATTLAAVSGYPHLTVPMGQIHGLPVGLSFVGPAWSEALLLSLGYSFEQRAQARRPPTYIATVGDLPDVQSGLVPAPAQR